MKRREDKKMKNLSRKKIWVFSLLVWLGVGFSCSGFTIGGIVPNDEPLTAPFPPKPETDYGKFVIYYVGQGKIKTAPTKNYNTYLIPYHIGDLTYYPSMEPASDLQFIYNIKHPCGDGYDAKTPPQRDGSQTIFYKDFQEKLSTFSGEFSCNRTLRPASDFPEAIVVNNQLQLYYTNFPYLAKDDSGEEALMCDCFNLGVCTKVNGLWTDFSDVPTDPASLEWSTLGRLNCYFKNSIEYRFPAYDEDWIRIPISQFGYNKILPLRIRILGDQFNMRAARPLKLILYETPAGGTPNIGVDKPVASSRFGIDFSRMQDAVLGYMARPDRDYWLLITDFTVKQGKNPLVAETYYFIVLVEATPVVPVSYVFDHSNPTPVVESTSYIYRAGIQRARSGNPALNNGPSFEPDDPSTKIEDIYPDCDGIPDTGDEGDWGIYEVCPVEGGGISDPWHYGIRDGNMQYWEVDNKSAIDDGETFRGVKTNLASMGDESPSVIQVGDQLWMFISTGSGIFQLSSLDGLKGLEWNLKNLYENRPSLVARKDAPGVPGDPEAPVVSSGRYGICDTKAQGDDVQAIPKGKGYSDAVCMTYGEDEYLDSLALVDEVADNDGTPIINSGSDGIINTWIFPNCVSYQEPVFWGYWQIKTEAPGNPDLFCGDSVLGASDENAYLFGDDQWATNAIGLNPPEYWRDQNCNPFLMAEEFNRCALGSRTNALAIKPGGDGQLQTVADFLKGDDRLCHRGELVGICPGKNGKFDRSQVEAVLRKLRKAPQGDDELCELNPAGGLEYVRFKFSNSVQLLHENIVPDSEIVVSFYLAFYKYAASFYGWPALGASEILTRGVDYDINYNTGEFRMLGNNWLDPIATLPFDSGFFGDPNSRLKDVLIVYYEYHGSQVGICPGANGVLETPAPGTFYPMWISWFIPDHILSGPALELSPTMGTDLGVNRMNLPRLGDTYLDKANLTWDSGLMILSCPSNTCPLSPGSDNTLDTAWVQEGSLSWYWGDGSWQNYAWPPNPPSRMRPLVSPNRYDLYGQYDDWLCPIDNQWALCPGGNGYFQLYQLWEKVEVARYEGIDDLLFNYKKSTNPCYILEKITEQDEFYESSEIKYVQNAYRGVMGDDRIVWNSQVNEYQVTTGRNGVNQSCVAPSDSQIIPRYQGVPYQKIIVPGANRELDTPALKDELYFEEIENEKPIPKIKAGADGICNSFKIGEDRPEIFFGTGAPDYACVLAGPNGRADTEAQGNDTQLYLPGEKTGFDAYQVDTPEIVKDGDKLYLYYSGLGWLKAPKSVPPSRGALGSVGECKRPGLDNRWGDLSYTWSTYPPDNIPRALLRKDGPFLNMKLYTALDDNQGVILAPRIGVAISTIDRIAQNPSDWDRVLEPVVDVGGICYSQIAGNLMSIVGGILPGISGGELLAPPIFNYYGSFSPEVFIKYNEADDQPIFMMFLNGIWMKKTPAKSSDTDAYNTGLYKPEIQVGLARSIDGVHFDLANDLNPLIVSGDLTEGLTWALGLGEEMPAFLHPTVFEADNDSYSMIFKTQYRIGISEDGEREPSLKLKSTKEWLGFAVRSGAVYGGGLAGLISCKITPQQLESSQNWLRVSASLLLLLPLATLILFRIWSRKSTKA